MRLFVAVLCANALAGCGRWGFEDQPDATPGVPDAAIDLACDVRTPPGTVALFSFDDGAAMLADGTGAHDGWGRGNTESVTGRCGTALGLAAVGDYVGIPDSPDFDLDQGAVSLYARVDTLGVRHGLLSRDANGTPVSGHFTLAVNSAGYVWLRMQTVGDVGYFRCSDEPITPGSWFHVGISFGPPGMALWIDHVRQDARDEVDVFEAGGTEPLSSCRTAHTGGINGPDDVWVIGGLIWTAVEGDPDPTPIDFLAGGAVDLIRIENTWTDFTTR